MIRSMADDSYDFGAAPKPRLAGSLKERKAKGTSSQARVVRDTVSSVQPKTEPAPVREYRPPPKKQNSPKKHAHQADEEEDYGDDDFEDYGDDFEEDEEEEQTAPAEIKTQPSGSDVAQQGQSKAGRTNNNVDTSTRAESKTPKTNTDGDQAQESTHRTKSSSSSSGTSSSSANKNKPAKNEVPQYKKEEMNRANRPKFGAMSMSMNGSMLGGGFKAKRLQKIMQSGVMDLQEEKFTVRDED